MLQLKALENLHRAGVDLQPAVMVSFSPADNVAALRKRLAAMAHGLRHIEIEQLALYRDVEQRLRKAGIKYTVEMEPYFRS